MRAPRPAIVYGLLGLGILSFAVSPILVRLAGQAPGLTVAVWRTALACLFLAPAAIARVGPVVRRFSARDVGLIIAAGVLLGLHFIFWIESLYHTSVASSSVLVTTSPLFLAVLGYVLLDERLPARTVAAIGMAVGGAALIGVSDLDAQAAAASSLFGNGLALLAALLVSLYLLIGRVVRQRVSWLAYVFPLYCVAAVTTLAAGLLRGTPLLGFDLDIYLLCAAMAVGPQIIGHGSFNYALQTMPAAIVGMLALLEPVGASLLAYWLFGEAPSGLAVIGMLTVLAAVSVVTLLNRRGEASPGEEASAPAEEAQAAGSGVPEGPRSDAGRAGSSRRR